MAQLSRLADRDVDLTHAMKQPHPRSSVSPLSNKSYVRDDCKKVKTTLNISKVSVFSPTRELGTEFRMMNSEYGSAQENKLEVAEMQMQHWWMCGVTELDNNDKKCKNQRDNERGSGGSRGYLKESKGNECDAKRGVPLCRKAMGMELQGKGGRPERRWMDCVRGDIREKTPLNLREEGHDRATWTRIHIDPHIKVALRLKRKKIIILNKIIRLAYSYHLAKMWAISSDTHQLHYIPKHHFII